MPRDLDIAFTKVVKAYANDTSFEITHQMIDNLFRTQYMLSNLTELKLLSCTVHGSKAQVAASDDEAHISAHGDTTVYLQASIAINCIRYDVCGSRQDILSSIMKAVKQFGFGLQLLDHEAKLLGRTEGSSASRRTASFVKLISEDMSTSWGVGIHEHPVWASF